MHKLIPFASLTALVIGVFVALTVAGAFDDDSAASPGDGERAETSALCVDGAEDCDDTVVIVDTDEGDMAGEDKQDRPISNGGDEPVQPISGDDGETGSNNADEPDEGEALAIEAAYAALEAMGGPPAAEVDLSGIKSVDWNDACLGIETEGIACAQVITPGFIIFLSGASGDYEFHTDTRGHAVLADPAE